MELFSLEEDDGNDLFITQSSHLDNNNRQNVSILGSPTDFASPCASILNANSSQYSDISDDEFVDIPCSQQPNVNATNSTRYLKYHYVISFKYVDLFAVKYLCL